MFDKHARAVTIIDRTTGEPFIEKLGPGDMMLTFYGSRLRTALTTRLVASSWLGAALAWLQGRLQDTSPSRRRIPRFIAAHDLDVSEFEREPSAYRSFNEFFARRLKPAARPVAADPRAVVSPGDGCLLVFPTLDETTLSYVKWAPVRLFDLFNRDDTLVQRFRAGAALVLRLRPADYHRVHFPVPGVPGESRVVPGHLHTVSAYAMEQGVPVYCLNKRTLCPIRSPAFGLVLGMEIGAGYVSSIVQTYRPGVPVDRGAEKSSFCIGGSCAIFFFERDVIEFDADLVRNSGGGLETRVRMGESIGKLAEGRPMSPR